ncbi:hypothetical protein F503_01390 [Ophiostoma piceae UAMH 11346]|uniref:Uncharacterized protein n=1 Tax=Ophiostoma piceae (strain UAMH 11346) TaxID=1262450 RepID=S3BY41_OPHP1|nr:hypothetical protein F503_01390 [Ophiostoma piceae UAMH 11346]
MRLITGAMLRMLLLRSRVTWIVGESSSLSVGVCEPSSPCSSRVRDRLAELLRMDSRFFILSAGKAGSERSSLPSKRLSWSSLLSLLLSLLSRLKIEDCEMLRKWWRLGLSASSLSLPSSVPSVPNRAFLRGLTNASRASSSSGVDSGLATRGGGLATTTSPPASSSSSSSLECPRSLKLTCEPAAAIRPKMLWFTPINTLLVVALGRMTSSSLSPRSFRRRRSGNSMRDSRGDVTRSLFLRKRLALLRLFCDCERPSSSERGLTGSEAVFVLMAGKMVERAERREGLRVCLKDAGRGVVVRGAGCAGCAGGAEDVDDRGSWGSCEVEAARGDRGAREAAAGGVGVAVGFGEAEAGAADAAAVVIGEGVAAGVAAGVTAGEAVGAGSIGGCIGLCGLYCDETGE